MPSSSSAPWRVSDNTDVNSSFGAGPKSLMSSIRSASSLGSFGSNSESRDAGSKSRRERKKKKKNGSGGMYVPSERVLRMVEDRSGAGLGTTTGDEESPLSDTGPEKHEDEKEVSSTKSKKKPGRAGVEKDEKAAISKNEKENHSINKLSNKYSKVVLDDDVSSLATAPSSIDDSLDNARRSQQQTKDAGVVGKSVCTGWIS